MLNDTGSLLDQFPSAAITPTLLLPVRVVFSVHLRGRLSTVGKSVEDPSSPLLLLRRDIGQGGPKKLLVLSRHVHCSNTSSCLPSRIAELKAIINNPETSDEQKINVQVAINLYGGKMQPIPRVCIQGGKVINLQKLDFSRPFWMEHGVQQFAHRVAYDLFPGGSGHQMLARMRAIPAFSLSLPLFLDITMLNDTGSDALTVFDTDLIALGIAPTYLGFGPQTQA
ncbi:hypothetical protein A7C99_6791 [Trichophyton rubrum]|uniref:Uncharacterized protein n=1 Tax=Trichophyton rubrum TaxID=5551 RepID=A0A178EQ96_TRIRU|nr:hypothetical protein A7C99_6791 [Trichophyton rubrum]